LEETLNDVKDRMKVVAADINTAVGRRYAVLLGIRTDKFEPQIRILRVEKHKSESFKFNFTFNEISKDNIKKFVKAYHKNKIQ
jgi:hypothetical protein